jgi:hypothetical protein
MMKSFFNAPTQEIRIATGKLGRGPGSGSASPRPGDKDGNMALFKKWYDKLPRYKPSIDVRKHSHADLLEAAVCGHYSVAMALVEGGHITDEEELAAIVEANRSFAHKYILDAGLIRDRLILRRLATNEGVSILARISAARQAEDYDLLARLTLIREADRERTFQNGHGTIQFWPNEDFVVALSRTGDPALARAIVEFATKDRAGRDGSFSDVFKDYLNRLASATRDAELRAMINAKRRAFFGAQPGWCTCVHPVESKHTSSRDDWNSSFIITVYCSTCRGIMQEY